MRLHDFVFNIKKQMLPSKGAVLLLSRYIHSWCVAAGVKDGLVFQQLKYARDNIICSSVGRNIRIGILGSSHSSASRMVGQRPVEDVITELTSGLYEPVAIMVANALRLRYGVKFFKKVTKAFGLKVGVKKVRIGIAGNLSPQKVAQIEDELMKMYDYKVDLMFKVDSRLLSGWTLFVDFFKVDASGAGMVRSVVNSLDFLQARGLYEKPLN